MSQDCLHNSLLEQNKRSFVESSVGSINGKSVEYTAGFKQVDYHSEYDDYTTEGIKTLQNSLANNNKLMQSDCFVSNYELNNLGNSSRSDQADEK